MICERIDSVHWRLSFSEPEAGFIINVLAKLGRNYQEDIAGMPPALRSYWQGNLTRSGTANQEDLTDSQEVLAEARAELRSERLALVET